MPGSGAWRASWSSELGSVVSPLPPGSPRSATRSLSASSLTRSAARQAAFTRDGFTFDTGPSLLTLPAVYRDLFIKTGQPIEESLDIVAVDPTCHYRFADGSELTLPNASRSGGLVEPSTMRSGPGAGTNWDRLLERAQAIWLATRTPFLEQPLGRDGRPAAPGHAAPATCARSRRGGPCVAWAPHYLRDPRQRMVLDRYATYGGSDPRRAPAAMAVIPLRRADVRLLVRPGRAAPAGPWRCTTAQSSAAPSVRTDSDVAEVIVESGRACGCPVVIRRGDRGRRRGRQRRRRHTCTHDPCPRRRRGPHCAGCAGQRRRCPASC